MPATKTANVNARIDLNVKTQAESILSQLGLPRSVAIGERRTLVFIGCSQRQLKELKLK